MQILVQINAGISRISPLPIRLRVCLTCSIAMVITLHRSSGSWLICVLDKQKQQLLGKINCFENWFDLSFILHLKDFYQKKLADCQKMIVDFMNIFF